MTPRRCDPGLYLVTDRALAGERSIEDLVRAAVRGGVSMVQLREKALETREFVELARRLKVELAAAGGAAGDQRPAGCRAGQRR